jgi:hypothetical protein
VGEDRAHLSPACVWSAQIPHERELVHLGKPPPGLLVGLECVDAPKREAGRLVDIGSGDSLNDNGAAAHLLTILPFALILLLTEKSDKRVRAVALVATPLIINTIILCNSRGAIVGIVAALFAALLLIRSGYRTRLIGAGVITVVAFLALADQQFLDRQQSTTSYEDDGSAHQRLETWKGGRQLVLDRPFGAGGKGFHLLSPVYIPSIVTMHGGTCALPTTPTCWWHLNGASSG